MQSTIIQHLSADPILKNVIVKSPFRWLSVNSKGVYQDLLGSIISQQLSTKVAAVIENRFLSLFEDNIPHPEKLLSCDIDTLRGVGLSRQKAAYLQNVAAFFKAENLENQDWNSMDDKAILNYLTQIKGVGQWTVEMILMFSLERPDVLPLDDFGISSAMVELYGLKETGKTLRQTMQALAEPWRPYRSYACWYLWRFKEMK
ncbi:MAG: DNA-3-methyladenine glycosylase 2 family protein [Lewinellaceae bacterium]|nr:DNA-3-methyladenine glycosylase 2 family protein [Saprospiraceae bacterium]MCB9338046.1 DNA-3-methyladenine glycosylase 2 family protein [Lewinellaceae bacterium]